VLRVEDRLHLRIQVFVPQVDQNPDRDGARQHQRSGYEQHQQDVAASVPGSTIRNAHSTPRRGEAIVRIRRKA
jgi:hypothetical protein